MEINADVKTVGLESWRSVITAKRLSASLKTRVNVFNPELLDSSIPQPIQNARMQITFQESTRLKQLTKNRISSATCKTNNHEMQKI